MSEGGLEHTFEGNFPGSGKFPWVQRSGPTTAPARHSRPSVRRLLAAAVPGPDSGQMRNRTARGESLSSWTRPAGLAAPCRLDDAGPYVTGVITVADYSSFEDAQATWALRRLIAMWNQHCRSSRKYRQEAWSVVRLAAE